MPVGNTRRIRLTGIKARHAADIKMISPKVHIATATIHQAPHNGPMGIWTVSLKALSQGSADIEAKFKNEIIATLNIKVIVEKELTLPIQMSKQGVLARLLLVENINPSEPEYNSTDTKQAMQWMRLVVENRMSHKKPELFNAKIGQNKTWDIYDIVKARGQFHGFEHYPNLSLQITKNIGSILSIANDYNDSRREQYADYVETAVDVASAFKTIKDPCVTGLYGWRTNPSKHPGGQYVKYKVFAGQIFYTLQNEGKKDELRQE
jgi:hypothetical protein